MSFSFVRCEYAPSRCHLYGDEFSEPEYVRKHLRVKAMVTDHREGLFWQGGLIFQYMIQILHILWVTGIIREVGDLNICLIMAPREHDIFETAMRLVDPIL